MDNKNVSDEIDLEFLFRKITNVVKKMIRACLNGLNFIFRNWIILLILVVVGAGIGYFMQSGKKKSQTADVVIRTNFETGEYTYNALNILQAKIKENDTTFLAKKGFRVDTLELNKIEIQPIVNFTDISKRFDPNDRNLEILLKSVEFEEETERSNSFNTSYKYHTVTMSLSHVATNKTVDKVIDYLNNQELIQEVAKVGRQNIIDQIERNDMTFAQIDSVLETYSKTESLSTSNSQIYVVDKNFNISQVLELKMLLQTENKALKDELVFAKNAIVKLNDDPVVAAMPGLLDKKVIMMPLLLVFLFLFFSWLRHTYFYLKKFSQE
jgi:hypothetical protein